ncbi:hypothetical protein HG530_013934 [Fusarium avenaceum]|nr:hypothetical protein HG530_013934 [Fusarium avenaceum]
MRTWDVGVEITFNLQRIRPEVRKVNIGIDDYFWGGISCCLALYLLGAIYHLQRLLQRTNWDSCQTCTYNLQGEHFMVRTEHKYVTQNGLIVLPIQTRKDHPRSL